MTTIFIFTLMILISILASANLENMQSLINWITIISGISSISGISLLSICKFFFTKEKYMKLLKYKPILLTVIIIFALSLMLSWKPWQKVHYGDLSRPYKPTVIHDTVFKEKSTLPIKKPVTIIKSKPLKLDKKTKVVDVPIKENSQFKKDSKLPDTNVKNQTISSGNNAHIINGNGNNVAVNGDQYINIKPRHIDDATEDYIDSFHIDKSFDIDIVYSINDEESRLYGLEIYEYLIKKGFDKVKGSAGMIVHGWNTLHITVVSEKKYASIWIPVHSNVKQ